MISVFDKHTEQNDFNTCGLRILNPLSAYVTEELNGKYTYEVSCPMIKDDDSWQFLQPFNILKSNSGQLFPIYKTVTSTVNGVPTLTAYANHIWYYLADMAVINAEGTKNARDAIAHLFTPAIEPEYRNQPFTGGPTLFSFGTGLTSYDFHRGFSTNLEGDRHYKYKHCSLAYALLGSPDSILNLWGGYLHRDNFNWSINKDCKEGTISDAFELSAGYNCEEVKHTLDYSKRITSHWGFDQFGAKFGISLKPDSGIIPHQVITTAEYSVDQMWEGRGYEDGSQIAVYTGEYYHKNNYPADTYEVNYVDSKGTFFEDGWNTLRYLKVGDSGYVTSLDGVRKAQSIISVRYNDITSRIDSLKLGQFIHSQLHENRWDKIISDDTAAYRRLDAVENRMNYFELVRG